MNRKLSSVVVLVIIAVTAAYILTSLTILVDNASDRIDFINAGYVKDILFLAVLGAAASFAIFRVSWSRVHGKWRR